MSESTRACGTHKACSKCKQVKPVDAFGRNARATSGYQSWCRACYAEHQRQYRASPEGRERVRASQRDSYQRNREQRIAAVVEYEKRNPRPKRDRSGRDRATQEQREADRAWYAANREQVLARKAAWAAANPGLVTEARRRGQAVRRARKRALPVERYTLAQIIERDGTLCLLCGEEMDLMAVWPDPKVPTVEHLECLSWPDSAGDVLLNVSAAHYDCNNRRRANPHPAAARKRAELLALDTAT